MNILFYLEPLIEQQKPYWKEGWLNYFLKNLLANMPSGSDTNWNYFIVLNEPIYRKWGHLNYNNAEFIVIEQSELTKDFLWSAYDLTMTWYDKGATSYKVKHDYYVDLYRNKLNSIKPDIIITFSPVPFLNTLYPQIKVLHFEFGFVSRPPFPHTWFFDPIGTGGYKYLELYWDEIKNSFSLDESELTALNKLKTEVKSLISNKNPFKNIAMKWKEKFNCLILAPLQLSGVACVDGIIHHKSQFERLYNILALVPSHVGVIVTTHPEYPILGPDQLEFLSKKFPNLIYDNAFETIYSSSQYLYEFVDGVVGTSWSVAAQALIWDLPVIPIRCDNQFSFISNLPSLQHIDWLKLGTARKYSNNLLLFWILTRLAIPAKVLHDGKWLPEFLKYAQNIKTIDKNFYKVFTKNTSEFLNEWVTWLSQDLPINNWNLSLETTKLQLNKNEITINQLQSNLDLLNNALKTKDIEIQEFHELHKKIDEKNQILKDEIKNLVNQIDNKVIQEQKLQRQIDVLFSENNNLKNNLLFIKEDLELLTKIKSEQIIQINDLSLKVNNTNKKISSLLNSRSWKLMSPARFLSQKIKQGLSL